MKRSLGQLDQVNLESSGPEVLFKTCVAMKFVDDDDDDTQTA